MMRKGITCFVVVITALAVTVPNAPVAAGGIFKSPLGSAALGALIGGIAGGGNGAAIGAAVGGGVGLVGKAGEEQRKREAAERRHQEERGEWERQRQLEQDRLRQERQQSQAQSPEAILVSETQRSLIRLGYDPGPVGTMNPQTTAAIKDYQASKGLLETGQPSQELLRHMITHGG